MSNTQKFLFMGNGGTANRGCEAILLSTIAMLEARFPGSRYINSSYGDSRIRATPYLHRGNVLHRPHPEVRSVCGMFWQFRKRMLGHQFNFQKYLRHANIVLALGGDNYSLDYGVPTAFFEANKIVLAAKKPLVIWGASIGPFTGDSAFETYAKEELKRVNLICARESRTVDYLDSLGIRDNVCRVADPAFLLEPEEPALTLDELKILESPHIGLNLSPLLARYQEYGKPWAQHAADIIRQILRTQHYPIALIPHVMQRNNDDYEFLKITRERLAAEGGRLRLVGPNHSSREYKWLISKCLVFFGARTHATIAALSSCVPTLSLSYSMKSIGLNEDIFGDRAWLVPLSELKPVPLSERISELVTKADDVRRYLETVMPSYAKHACDALPQLTDLLEQATTRVQHAATD